MAPISRRGTEKPQPEMVRHGGECDYCTFGALVPGKFQSLRRCMDFLDIIVRIGIYKKKKLWQLN